MGRNLGIFRGGGQIRGLQISPYQVPFSSTFFESFKMNEHVKSYLYFIAFMAVTKIVVAPIAKSLNVPIVSDILG